MELTSWPTLFTAVGILVVSFYVYKSMFKRKRWTNLPPGEVSFFNSFVPPSEIPKHFNKIREDARPLFRSMFWGQNSVVIQDADIAKRVLPTDGDAIASSWPPATATLLGPRSFSVVHGAPHRAIRKQLAQAFSSQAIERYLPQIQALSENRIKTWLSNGNVKFHDESRLVTFEVMAKVVAGCQLEEGAIQELSRDYDTFVKGLFFVAAINLPWTAYGKALRARAKIIAALAKALDDGGLTEGGLLARVAQGEDHNSKPFSRESVLDNGVTLLFAGHETTATSLSALMLMLLERPEVVERMRMEQREVVRQYGEAITGEAIREMKYLDAVVKEGWRLFPIVGLVPRTSLRDHDVAGYTVPKGWGLTFHFWKMIRSDTRWEGRGKGFEHEVFNPDRWLGPEGGGVGVLPGVNSFVFGGGSRSCLGAPLAWAEMKVIMALLLRTCKWECPLGRTPTWQQIPLKFEEDFPLTFSPLTA